MRRWLGPLLAATGAAAISLSAPPAFATGHDDGAATIEEFVCFRSTGHRISLGTGKVITTPSGEVRVVCTGAPFGSTSPETP